MRRHLDFLGYCYIATGVLGLLVALVVFFALVGGGLLSGDGGVIAITAIVAVVVGGFLALLSIPSLVAGYGLLKRRPWARLLTLVLGALNLFNAPPLGTLLGIYTFWVLLQDEAEHLLSATSHRH